MTRILRRSLLIVCLLLGSVCLHAQSPVNVVRVKYDGGGDWYGNRTTFVNLFDFMKSQLSMQVASKEATLSILDKDFFRYPIAYISGHGNIKFSDTEVTRLREYLIKGGFLWADDDFGMDKHFRREMEKVFPDQEWVEIPYSHPIYHINYNFPNGLPKIHKHAGGPPRGYGLFHEGRMVAFYSFNTDLSDGCENADIHENPPEVREAALKMGTNIILWALLQ